MRTKRGFTLIELLVVIAIIGILATLIMVQLSSSRARANNSLSKSNITSMGTSIEVFKNDPRVDEQVIGTKTNDFSWAGNSLILSKADAPQSLFSKVASLFNVSKALAVAGPPPASGYIPVPSIFTGTLAIDPANAGCATVACLTSSNTYPTKIQTTPSDVIAFYYGTHASGSGIGGTMAVGATGDGKYFSPKASGNNDCYILQVKGLSTAAGTGETNPVFAIIDGKASSYATAPTCP